MRPFLDALTGWSGGVILVLVLKRFGRIPVSDIAPLRVRAPPSETAPIHFLGNMANPIQLDLFAHPPDDFDCPAGFFSRDIEVFDKPPTKETNATKKRNKRHRWYISQCIKKDGSQR